MSHEPGLFHKGCDGGVVSDWSRTYQYEGYHAPSQRCKKCGEEIIGDSEVVLYNLDGEEVSEYDK